VYLKIKTKGYQCKCPYCNEINKTNMRGELIRGCNHFIQVKIYIEFNLWEFKK